MNRQCPACGVELRQGKLAQALTRMELDCPGCKNRVELNLHPTEVAILLAGCAAFLLLAIWAYRSQSQGLMLGALACAGAAWTTLVVLERTLLRSWSRYVRKT